MMKTFCWIAFAVTLLGAVWFAPLFACHFNDCRIGVVITDK